MPNLYSEQIEDMRVFTDNVIKKKLDSQHIICKNIHKNIHKNEEICKYIIKNIHIFSNLNSNTKKNILDSLQLSSSKHLKKYYDILSEY